jgi:hypothetical protein
MKLVFTFLMLLFSVAGFSQGAIRQPVAFVGRWEVISIKNPDFYHHYEKDSTVLFESARQLIRRSAKDSMVTMHSIDLIKKFMGNFFFTFGTDGHFEHRMSLSGKRLTEEGTFSIDEFKNEIRCNRTTTEGAQVEDTLPFKWKGKNLLITMSLDDNTEAAVTVELKKI